MIRQGLAGAFVCMALAARAYAADAAPTWPVAVEAQTGANTPLSLGLGVLFDRDGWFSGGAGIGLDFGQEARSEERMIRFGLFSRARLLRKGPFRFGLALNLSRGHYRESRTYTSNYYADSKMEWHWGSATRLDLGLAAEVRLKQFSLRLEGGPAFLLGAPTCTFTTALQSYAGSCSSPAIPSPYHLSPEPGRIAPYLLVSFAYRPSVGGHEGGSGASAKSATAPRSASGWTGGDWGYSILAADGAGLVGGLALGGLAYLVVQDTFRDVVESAASKHSGLTVMATAGAIGFAVGSAAGATWYGRGTARRGGSFAASLFGSVLGMAVASGLTAAVWMTTPAGSHDTAKGLATAGALVPVLPALGATLGYFTSSSAPAPQLALVQYEAGSGATFGMPIPLVATSATATTVNVPLAAGRF